eukprot:5902242-Pyramimonas_sp.AAC.2
MGPVPVDRHALERTDGSHHVAQGQSQRSPAVRSATYETALHNRCMLKVSRDRARPFLQFLGRRQRTPGGSWRAPRSTPGSPSCTGAGPPADPGAPVDQSWYGQRDVNRSQPGASGAREGGT